MNENPRDLALDSEPAVDEMAQDAGRRGTVLLWVNWALALVTIVVAAFVLVFALGAMMSTAACTTPQCPGLASNGYSFDVMFYGAPAIAAAVIVLSFFTAGRRWGFAVPLCGLMLLAADIITLRAAVAS